MLNSITQPPTSAVLLRADGKVAVTVELQGSQLVATIGGARLVSLVFDEAETFLDLTSATGDPVVDERALSAVFEALFGWRPNLARVALSIGAGTRSRDALLHRCLRNGLIRRDANGLFVQSDLLMQRRGNWMSDAETAPYPLDYTLTEGRRHPRRAPKPEGCVYTRHIPWLEQEISFRALSLDDLPLFNRWMNDARIAAFWNEAGPIEAHRAYLSNLIADPHTLPLIGCFGNEPFGYFEIYWAKENRIAPFYDADDYDRGWHVAVGNDAFRGRRYVSAWLPSLMHYMFLDDPRTSRIVGEPASTHTQQIRNLEVSGFAKLKTFEFPHKRATLVMLLRERFFGDRLWLPATATPSG